MGRHSSRSKAALSAWERRKSQQPQLQAPPYPALIKPIRKPSKSTTPRSTLHARNLHLKKIIDNIHGDAEGGAYGVQKLLYQYYPQIIETIEEECRQDLTKKRLTIEEQQRLTWDCIAAKEEGRISTRGWTSLQRRLEYKYDVTTKEYIRRTVPGTDIPLFSIPSNYSMKQIINEQVSNAHWW